MKRSREAWERAALDQFDEQLPLAQPPTPGEVSLKRSRIQIIRFSQTLLTRFFSGTPRKAPVPVEQMPHFTEEVEANDE